MQLFWKKNEAGREMGVKCNCPPFQCACIVVDMITKRGSAIDVELISEVLFVFL